MSKRVNELGQPIGAPMPEWVAPGAPPREPLHGRFCRVEPIVVSAHASDLFQALCTGGDERWTYLPYGPIRDERVWLEWLSAYCLGDDPQFYTIVEPVSGKAVGMASYLRITPGAGVIEVGHLHYGPRLQRTPAATEAMYLMMRRAFGLGYRRYEWKCDSLNAPSRAAALRLGFSFEGIFRQAVIYKGRSRDTAWYSIIDSEWPEIDTAFQRWLDPANFDGDGRQVSPLAARR